MKLSKTTLLIITAGVLIIALAGVGVRYSQKAHEQNQMKEQLTSAQSRLNGIQLEQLSAKQTELEKQLSLAIAQFEAVKAPFSTLAGSTTTISTFLDVAYTNGLKVTEIKSPGPAEGELEELAFWVVPLTAKVKGDTSDLINFLLELNSSLVTGVIQSVTIQGDDAAEIKVVVYTYRGD